MKKTNILSASMWSICLLLAFAVQPFMENRAGAEGIKIKYGSYAPHSIIDEPILWYFNEVSKRSGVKIEVETYFGGVLAKPMDCLDAIGKGVYDTGWISSVYTPAKTPLAIIPNATPMIATSLGSASAGADTLLSTLPVAAEEFKKANVMVMFHTGVWNYKLITKKPVKSLEEIKGLRVRTFGYLSKVWEELGGIPVSIPVSETYDALQKGVIDGALTQPISMYQSLRLFEVAKNYFDIDLGCLAAPALMNIDTFEKLPEKVRKVMLDLRSDMPRITDEITTKQELKALEDMKKKGLKIYEPSEADKARIKDVGKFIAKFVAEDLKSKGIHNSQEAMDKYLNGIERYTKK